MRREKGKAGSHHGSSSYWQGMTIPNDGDEQRPCADKGKTIVPQRVGENGDLSVITDHANGSRFWSQDRGSPGGARELILKFVLNYWLHLNALKDYVGGASIN